MELAKRLRPVFVILATFALTFGALGTFSALDPVPLLAQECGPDGENCPDEEDHGGGGGGGGACTCVYASQCYTAGACVTSVCGSGRGQQCLSGGSWTGCKVC